MIGDIGGFNDAILTLFSSLLGLFYTPALFNRALIQDTQYDPMRRKKISKEKVKGH